MLNSQKYPLYTKWIPLSSKFLSVSLYDQLFSRSIQYCRKSEMYGMTSDWSWTLLSKIPCIYYVLNSETQILARFTLQPAVEIQGCQKLEMHHMILVNDLGHLTNKSTPYTLSDYSWGLNLVYFVLRPAIFEVQGCQKSEKSECTEWPENEFEHINSQKCHVYIEHLPTRPKFCSVFLYDKPLSSYNVVKNWKNWKGTNWPQNDLKH